MNKTILVLSVFWLSGCATTVVPPTKAEQAPKERLFEYQRNDGKGGSLTVVRDQGMVGGGCFATVYLNGMRAAKLDPKEKAVFYLPPGEWAVGANIEGRGLCNYSGERQERFISIKQGENKKARIFTDGEGNMDIRPTTLN